jgi:hypothetical protein
LVFKKKKIDSFVLKSTTLFIYSVCVEDGVYVLGRG